MRLLKEGMFIAVIGVFVAAAGIVTGVVLGGAAEQKRLGTAVCKHLNSKFAMLDQAPVCITPAGIMRFYEE